MGPRLCLRPSHGRTHGALGRVGTWLPGEEVSLLPSFIFFILVREPGLWALKSMWRLRPRCQGPQWVRIRTVKPSGAPCAASWDWRTEMEATVHLQDPASWAELPAPFQAGRIGE